MLKGFRVYTYSMEKPYLIAHRGGAGDKKEKENSLEAIQVAISISRVDFVEIDIHKTRDDQFVLFHNSKVGSLPINSFSFKELKGLTEPKDIELARLEDVLEIIKQTDKKLNIELKEVGYLEEIAEKIFNNLSSDQVVFSSFRKDVVKDLKVIVPNSRKGLILFENYSWLEVKQLFRIEEIVEQIHPDFIVLPYRAILLGAIKNISTWKYPIWAWGINHQKEILKVLKDKRIEGIITDYPRRVSDLELII